ncbi:hypothetical protein [Kribbella flavida]|uniref:hypothetical protein n=1 Tax=Kribbella flavida TaxID=182640 RepID=UPI0011D26C01|nr:hypothetical protein [Kribbella flavida]
MDLVERGLRRGITLRRRRTAVRGITAIGATLTTAAVVMGGINLVGSSGADGVSVAGAPAPAASVDTTAATTSSTVQTTPQQTLRTLKALLPRGLQVSGDKVWGDNFIGVSVLADDGKGASHIEASVQTSKLAMGCANQPTTVNCKVRPDGSTILAYQVKPTRTGEPIINSVSVYRPDGRVNYASSANATATKKAAPTRTLPLLSITQLTQLVDSPLWKFPPASYGKDQGR